MRTKNHLFVAIAIVSLISCAEKAKEPTTGSSLENEKTELIALGPYPDFYYNLANELNNSGRSELAKEAYNNCISESNSQTFIEDAMFNLSMLYFESQQDSLAYSLMDSLIARKRETHASKSPNWLC